jgi:hypothetical protein
VPKKPRQAHVQRQITRKRKSTRRAEPLAVPENLGIEAAAIPGVTFRNPVAPIPPPVAPAAARAVRSAPAPVRAGTARAAGQLPTFERAYLVDELKRIAVISTSLLAVIVVLTLVLR